MLGQFDQIMVEARKRLFYSWGVCHKGSDKGSVWSDKG